MSNEENMWTEVYRAAIGLMVARGGELSPGEAVRLAIEVWKEQREQTEKLNTSFEGYGKPSSKQ